MTNRGIVRPKVLNRYGLVANDQRVSTATIDEFIQTALNRIATAEDWWWLRGTGTINTIAGTRAYALVTDLQKIKMMYWQNIPITMVQPERTVELELVQGRPSYYFLTGDNLVSLYPLPDAVYQISYLYYSLEVTIANDSTAFKLPDRFEDLIVAYTCVYIARRLNDGERENEFKEEVALLMAEAKRSNMRGQGHLLPVRRLDWMNYG